MRARQDLEGYPVLVPLNGGRGRTLRLTIKRCGLMTWHCRIYGMFHYSWRMRTCVQARQKKSKRKGESNDEVKALFIQIAGDYNAGRGRTVRGGRGSSFSAASVAVSRELLWVVSGLANVKRDLWQMKTMLMRIPVDVANEVAAAIQLSHCGGRNGGGRGCFPYLAAWFKGSVRN